MQHSKFSDVDPASVGGKERTFQVRSRRNRIWKPAEIQMILKALDACPRGAQRAMLAHLSNVYNARLTTAHVRYWRRRTIEEANRK